MKTHLLPLSLAASMSMAACGSQGAPAAVTPGPAPGPVRPPSDHATPGSATPADPGMTLPPGHPAVPLSDPTVNNDHVGRTPRRLNVVQFRASLLNAVGVIWTAPRQVLSADYPTGYYNDPNADMLAALATTLGQPDYQTFTAETLDPAPTFSKLASDAAHKACRDGLTADLARPVASRLLLRYAGDHDTAAAAPDAIRQNLSYLALRFWARALPASDPTIDRLFQLYSLASTAPADPAADGGAVAAAGTPVDGWRAVCIALVTDPQFLTY